MIFLTNKMAFQTTCDICGGGGGEKGGGEKKFKNLLKDFYQKRR